MPKTHTTGFLDLPLELRQMIYGHILPSDRTMNYPASQQRLEEENTVLAVCDTIREIHEELEEMMYKKCGARITVTPHKKMDIPLGIEFDRFQWINLTIDHPNEGSRRERWSGMGEIIKRLGNGHREVLPDMTISFHEDEENASSTNNGGDAKWTEHVPMCHTYCWRDSDYGSESEEEDYDDDIAYVGNHPDTWLRTEPSLMGMPTAAIILDDFLALRPCKSAVVHPLRGLQERDEEFPRHHPTERIFDKSYMEDLCAALERWLRGERDDVDMWFGISSDGEPRLEQLAYLAWNTKELAYTKWCEGQLYCDGIRTGS